jgi:hypothetical protein
MMRGYMYAYAHNFKKPFPQKRLRDATYPFPFADPVLAVVAAESGMDKAKQQWDNLCMFWRVFEVFDFGDLPWLIRVLSIVPNPNPPANRDNEFSMKTPLLYESRFDDSHQSSWELRLRVSAKPIVSKKRVVQVFGLNVHEEEEYETQYITRNAASVKVRAGPAAAATTATAAAARANLREPVLDGPCVRYDFHFTDSEAGTHVAASRNLCIAVLMPHLLRLWSPDAPRPVTQNSRLHNYATWRRTYHHMWQAAYQNPNALLLSS